MFARKDVYISGCLTSPSAHTIFVITVSRGQNWTHSLTSDENNHCLGRKLRGKNERGTECFINKLCNNHSAAAIGNGEYRLWSRNTDETILSGLGADSFRQNHRYYQRDKNSLSFGKGSFVVFFGVSYWAGVWCKCK